MCAGGSEPPCCFLSGSTMDGDEGYARSRPMGLLHSPRALAFSLFLRYDGRMM